MSALNRTEAIVLRGVRFGESSEIVSLFTRKFGKVKAVAKGKRRPGSQLASALEPFSLSEIVIYFKSERDVQFIKEARSIRQFDGFRNDYRRATAGFNILKLLDRALVELSPNEKVFEMTIKAFEILSEAYSQGVYYGYLVKFLSFMGHRLNIDRCSVCRKPLSPVRDGVLYFSPANFGPICETCYLRGEMSDVIKIDENTIEEIKALMWGYFYNLKSMSISYKTLEIIEKCIIKAFEITLDSEIISP